MRLIYWRSSWAQSSGSWATSLKLSQVLQHFIDSHLRDAVAQTWTAKATRFLSPPDKAFSFVLEQLATPRSPSRCLTRLVRMVAVQVRSIISRAWVEMMVNIRKYISVHAWIGSGSFFSHEVVETPTFKRFVRKLSETFCASIFEIWLLGVCLFCCTYDDETVES